MCRSKDGADGNPAILTMTRVERSQQAFHNHPQREWEQETEHGGEVQE